jgi:ATP-binding cassette subfamily B protein
MAEHHGFCDSWQERLSALRNTPPVLKIVWQSGPGVVIFGLIARLFASLLPLVLLWIPKLIVDAIVNARAAHERGVAQAVVAGLRPNSASLS